MTQEAAQTILSAAITPGGRNDHVEFALESSIAAYLAANPGSRSLFERAQRSMPGGNTRSALHFEPFPLYIASSAGCRMRDVDGKAYLDVLGEFTAGLYGHSNPVIEAAVAETVRSGVSNGAPGEAEVAFAELICDRFDGIEKVRFCNSGTEANLYALSLACAATGRTKVVGFAGAYHGGVLNFTPSGNGMNGPFDVTLCRYNDLDGTVAAIQRLGRDLAAVIVEPMLSNGGCIPADPDFLAALRAHCSAVGAVLVFDEVVTARMGSGGLQRLTGVIPDLTTLGKFLGGGFTAGAFGGKAALMDAMDPRRPGHLMHAGTFNNNAYTMSVGYRAYRELFPPARAERLFADGERLRARLNALAADVSPAVQFTGAGSIMNIHFVRGPIARPEDLAGESKQLFRLFHFDLMARGVYAAARGQINLSLPMGEAEFDLIADAVAHFLAQRRAILNAL